MTLIDIVQDARTLGYTGNVAHMNKLASKVYGDPSKVYEYMDEYGIGVDSVIREKLFTYIANKHHNGNYSVVYNRWLNNN